MVNDKYPTRGRGPIPVATMTAGQTWRLLPQNLREKKESNYKPLNNCECVKACEEAEEGTNSVCVMGNLVWGHGRLFQGGDASFTPVRWVRIRVKQRM